MTRDAEEINRRTARLRLNVEDERQRALFIKVLENTDLEYSVDGPIVTIETDVPEATLESLEDIMGGPLTRLPN